MGYEIVHESPGLELGVYVLVAPERTRSSRTKTAHERYYWARDEAKTGLGL